MTAAAAAKATAILTISEFSKREIVERLQVVPSRVSVTLLAADDLPLDETPAPLPELAAAISGPFFLTVGGQEGRKNLRTLYEAMALLHAQGVNDVPGCAQLHGLVFGNAEEAIARKIQILQLELGASGPSFPPIVAF